MSSILLYKVSTGLALGVMLVLSGLKIAKLLYLDTNTTRR